MSIFGKRLAFVLLIVIVLSSLVGIAVAQSEPQQRLVLQKLFISTPPIVSSKDKGRERGIRFAEADRKL